MTRTSVHPADRYPSLRSSTANDQRGFACSIHRTTGADHRPGDRAPDLRSQAAARPRAPARQPACASSRTRSAARAAATTTTTTTTSARADRRPPQDRGRSGPARGRAGAARGRSRVRASPLAPRSRSKQHGPHRLAEAGRPRRPAEPRRAPRRAPHAADHLPRRVPRLLRGLRSGRTTSLLDVDEPAAGEDGVQEGQRGPVRAVGELPADAEGGCTSSRPSAGARAGRGRRARSPTRAQMLDELARDGGRDGRGDAGVNAASGP